MRSANATTSELCRLPANKSCIWQNLSNSEIFRKPSFRKKTKKLFSSLKERKKWWTWFLKKKKVFLSFSSSAPVPEKNENVSKQTFKFLMNFVFLAPLSFSFLRFEKFNSKFWSYLMMRFEVPNYFSSSRKCSFRKFWLPSSSES